MQGKLIAGINSKVQLYKWLQTDDGSRELQLECSHTGHVLALYIVTRGDFVIVGGYHPLTVCPFATPPFLPGHQVVEYLASRRSEAVLSTCTQQFGSFSQAGAHSKLHRSQVWSRNVMTRCLAPSAGDLMRSMQLLIYRADEQLLEVRARDFKTHWMTAVEVLDDDTYLGAENSFNLFTLRKNSDAASDEDRNRLEARLFWLSPVSPCVDSGS